MIAVAAPILFYPFARTIWSAIDLAMRPLELERASAWRSSNETLAGIAASNVNADPKHACKSRLTRSIFLAPLAVVFSRSRAASQVGRRSQLDSLNVENLL